MCWLPVIPLPPRMREPEILLPAEALKEVIVSEKRRKSGHTVGRQAAKMITFASVLE